MQTTSKVLFWAGVALLMVFLFPSCDQNARSDGNCSRIRIGLPSSPWYEKTITRTEQPAPAEATLPQDVVQESGEGAQSDNFDKNVTQIAVVQEVHDVRTQPISGSSLLLLLGIGLIVVSRLRKPHHAQSI